MGPYYWELGGDLTPTLPGSSTEVISAGTIPVELGNVEPDAWLSILIDFLTGHLGLEGKWDGTIWRWKIVQIVPNYFKV